MTPQPAATLPQPHFCTHPTLPAAHSPRRLGGTQVEKGECQALGIGLPPPPPSLPTDSEGAPAFQQGQLESGASLGFRRAPGTSSLITLRGTGPRDPEQPPGNPDGASGLRRGGQRDGVHELAGCRVSALGTSRALGALWLRTVSSHSRALGQSQLRTCPSRAGQPWTPTPSSAPRRLRGQLSLAGGHRPARHSGWLWPPP